MATAKSYFSNAYTFEIRGLPPSYSSYVDAITENAIAAIEHLSDFVSWKGSLDFVVQFGSPDQFGSNGTGLLPAFGSVTSDGMTSAMAQALKGQDPNGPNTPELGLYLLPNRDGRLTNYGVPLYFDETPSAYEIQPIPAGNHDFFSIFLHESLHGLGFWSTAQHGSQYGSTAFDQLTTKVGAQYFFTGQQTTSLLGEPLPLAMTGSRDHYGLRADGAGIVRGGTVFEFGHYETRWHLGKVELAVLRDLGYRTANDDLLPLFQQPDDLVGRPREGGGLSDVGAPIMSAYSFFGLSKPGAVQTTALEQFVSSQFDGYVAQGVARPELGPFEAMGLALSGEGDFATRFASVSTQSFLATAYQEIFGRAPTSEQVAHFQNQIQYFQNLYIGVGFSSSQAQLQAKGAAAGQMLAYAVLGEPSSPYSEAFGYGWA